MNVLEQKNNQRYQNVHQKLSCGNTTRKSEFIVMFSRQHSVTSNLRTTGVSAHLVSYREILQTPWYPDKRGNRGPCCEINLEDISTNLRSKGSDESLFVNLSSCDGIKEPQVTRKKLTKSQGARVASRPAV